MTENDAYQVLAERHGYANSACYRRILELLMTPQQARIAAGLPGAPEEVAAKLKLDVVTVKEELNLLFRKGAVFPRNLQTMEGCRFARTPDQLHNWSVAPSRLDPVRYRELCRLWEDFSQEYWDRNTANLSLKGQQPYNRVVPAYKSVLDSPQLLPHEDVREMMKAASLIAMVSCPCRLRKEGAGKKCKRSHDANCIQLNRGAEVAISNGSGKKLSLDEALALIDEVEEDGLVHTWPNMATMSSNYMCNCCDDCCTAIDPAARLHLSATTHYAKSRYEARVEQDTCNGCQVCIDRCPFEAIDMVKPAGSKKLKTLVNAEKCMGCGVCVVGCEPKALGMKVVRPPEYIPGAI